MSFYDRLKESRINAGYTQEQLAQKIGVAKSTLSGYESGNRDPSMYTISKMMEILNVDANFLWQDEIDEQGGNPTRLKYNEIKHIEKYRSLDPPGQSHVDAVLQWETERVKQIEQATPATVIELSTRCGSRHMSEYFRDASAGGGIFILGNETASKIAIPDSEWDERTDYVIRVNGDSMMPDFQDGDNVMVSQHVELRHGDVGIFVVNGKAYIKEYGAEELVSRNPDSPNIPIHEYDNIVCMGKVIGKLDGGYEIIND